MIFGYVNDSLEATTNIEILSPTGDSRTIEVVIDTGFSDYLTLPPSLIAEFDLRFQDTVLVTLADGSDVELGTFDVTIAWDGESRQVGALQADTTPLIGMRLLENHRLRMDIVEDGSVTIEAIT
ncbi:MAG: clan AA aspartic protease [Chloroflexi bacterium]|nr:clan AA aspartic protease [Chloroflexota bacterium]